MGVTVGRSRRVTLREAALVLGISKEAVRKRVQRGTILSEIGEDGRRYAYLDAVGDDRGDDVHPGEDDHIDHHDPRDELIAVLREQLAAEREANRENRRLLAAALERIPAIESSETPRAPESADEEPTGTDVPPAPLDRETASSRPSWWRRFFGA